MRVFSYMLLASVVLPTAASAQEVSEKMTCEQAVAYFERHKQINTIVNGTVLPISQGTPIREAGLLECGGGESRFDTMVKTLDREECVVAAYCG